MSDEQSGGVDTSTERVKENAAGMREYASVGIVVEVRSTRADEIADQLEALADERDKLAAEIKRRDGFKYCDGCSSGDCPHGSSGECIEAQAKIIWEQEAEITDLESEIDRLRAVFGPGDLLAVLRKANLARCPEFGHRIDDWYPIEWACAVAGECGELCNLIKKRHRGDSIDPRDISDEIADIVIYLDLLSARLGVDLGAAIVRKFNLVSKRIGSKIVIAPMESEIDRQRAVFERLPKTKDGVHVGPGSIVYIDLSQLERWSIFGVAALRIEGWDNRCERAVFSNTPVGNKPGETEEIYFGIEDCYSTKDAALSARDGSSHE